MPRHVWSVLCDRSYTDKDTNNVLLACLEQLNIRAAKIPAEFSESPMVFIPVRHEIMTLWDEVGNEAWSVRVRVKCPNGNEVVAGPMELRGEGRPRLRSQFKLEHLPFGGEGNYVFQVEELQGDDYVRVAMLPLSLALNTQEPSTEPDRPG